MIPGIGLFYSGMTKRKSSLSLLWLSFMAMAVTSVQVCFYFKNKIIVIALLF
jgi:Amt family ammonium transporter